MVTRHQNKEIVMLVRKLTFKQIRPQVFERDMLVQAYHLQFCSKTHENWRGVRKLVFISYKKNSHSNFQYLSTFRVDFGEGRGYGVLNQNDFFTLQASYGTCNLLESHRKQAFQKEQDLSFPKHLKFLKSVHYRESYERLCI